MLGYILFIFIILYSTTGMSHLKVKCDCLINTLRNGRCNGLAEEGSLWRIFVLGVLMYRTFLSPFSRFLDGGTTALCFECACFVSEAVAAFSGISKHEPGYWRAVNSLFSKPGTLKLIAGRAITTGVALLHSLGIPAGLLFLQRGYIHLCWIHMSQPQSGMYKQGSILGGGSANTSRPVLTSCSTFLQYLS